MASITIDNMLDAFKFWTAAMTTIGNIRQGAARASNVGKSMVLARKSGLTADKSMPTVASGKFMVMGKDCKEKEAAELFIEPQISAEQKSIKDVLAEVAKKWEAETS